MDERRDDWKHGVDENLASLNTGQRVTDKQLDDLDLKYEAIDKVLRGDPETDTDGFIARLHNIENAVQELRAERIKRAVVDIQVKGIKWESATKIIVQILILVGMLLLGWDKVASLVNSLINQKPSSLEQRIEEAKHPKSPRKMYRERLISPSQGSNPSEQDNLK